MAQTLLKESGETLPSQQTQEKSPQQGWASHACDALRCNMKWKIADDGRTWAEEQPCQRASGTSDILEAD